MGQTQHHLHHFQVVRNIGAYKSREELIAEIPYNGNNSYDFFDNTYELIQGDVYYSVNAVYIRGEEKCESEYLDVMIDITDVEESTANINLYPNPTSGLLNIEGQGTMHITVTNLLGQTLQETTSEGSTTLDLSCYESGMYLIRIETENGVMVQKVNVRK